MRLQGRHGDTVFLLRATTPEEEAWLDEHIDPEGYQPDLPKQAVIEHRYLEDVLEGVMAAGFQLDRVGRHL